MTATALAVAGIIGRGVDGNPGHFVLAAGDAGLSAGRRDPAMLYPCEAKGIPVSTERRSGHGQRGELRVHQVDVNGRHPWVLEDEAGIVELADTEQTLEEDHPELVARRVEQHGQDT